MSLQKPTPLWTESASTITYVAASASIDKSKRFQFNSIYYRDETTKPKKEIDQLLFPFQILHDFRKSIRDARKMKGNDSKFLKKHRSINSEEKSKLGIGSKAKNVTIRLYQKPQLLPDTRDFYGIRSGLNEKKLQDICNISSQPNKALIKTSSCKKIYITASQRLDFGKPINFNPGPGSYHSGSASDLKKVLRSNINSESNHIKCKGGKSNLETITNSTQFKYH